MAVEVVHSIGPKGLTPHKNKGDEAEASSAQKRQQGSRSDVDQVRISDQARILKGEFESLRAQIQSASGKSEQRIQSVKQRIDNGFYSRDEVIEQVADRVLQSDNIRALIAGNNEVEKLTTAARQVPEVDIDKVTLARNRAAKGHYRRQGVLKVTAEKIIKNVLA